jgi:DNA-binding SARP family transcriptional activator
MHRYHLRMLGGLQLTRADRDAERRIDVQLKPLALLAFVSLHARDVPVRRDTIIALFWPELPSEQARLALRQALFHLRHAIGDDLIVARSDDSLAFVPDACSCDASELDAALARGDAPSAAGVYGGPLLDGVHIKGAANELEQQLDSERKRLACVATQAAWLAASEAEERGDLPAAAHWAHRSLALAPDDEETLRRAALLLERIGAGAAAQAALTTFAARLADEYDAEPAPATRHLLARLERAASAKSLSLPDPPPPPPSPPSVDAIALAPAIGRTNRSLWRVALGLAAILVIAAFTTDSAAGDADVVSRSPLARRLYEEGMGLLSARRNEEASQLFLSALREDSTCTVCARRAGEALREVNPYQARSLLHRATKIAGRAPRREQLLGRYEWSSVGNDPAKLALTDSLAARMPADVEGQLARADALMGGGRPLEALPILRRIAAADRGDSATVKGVDRPASEVWRVLVTALRNADSMSAATDAAREWTVRHPRAGDAWWHLVDALAREGRYSEAEITLDRLARRTPNDAVVMMMSRALLGIREGRYDVAERSLRLLEQLGRSAQSDELWWHTISLRNQGRQREALQLARGPLRRTGDSDSSQLYVAALAEGQALFELGRFSEAAERFRSEASRVDPADSGLTGTIARKRAWLLTHAGTALSANGDTVSLRALIDTVQVSGGKSGFARDPRLHYYLRGLLWCARGQPDSAERALRASLTSLSDGFTRENAELAALLIDRQRPSEAIPLARLALQGPMEASNAYITRTELQALLGRAFAAAGQADSAAVYRAAARHAWRGAEAPALTCDRAKFRRP